MAQQTKKTKTQETTKRKAPPKKPAATKRTAGKTAAAVKSRSQTATGKKGGTRQSARAEFPQPPEQQAAPGRLSRQRGALSPVEMLGEVMWLMMRSPAHKHFFLTDFEWLVMPPIQLRQVRLYHRDGAPFALASWARITEAVEQRLIAGARRLAPDDWNAGDRLWLIDIVTPFGGAEVVLEDLKKQFPGESLKSLRPKDDGSGMEVTTLENRG